MKRFIFLLVSTLIFASLPLSVAASPRYFYGGDGKIDVASGSGKFKGAYRDSSGAYVNDALAKINGVFGAMGNVNSLEPRFIEFLDYLQDEFKGGTIVIVSGYRSPEHNQSLRNNGKLAGKASMHQYGMASDFKMQGVRSEAIWNFVRELGYGGAGYYHGSNVHIDVGPARFWDETTSKVDTDIADDNKLISLVPNQDIYKVGDEMSMRFIRMTAYPIGVDRSFTLERLEKDRWNRACEFSPSFAKPADTRCPQFSGIDDMNNVRWTLPHQLAPGRYRIRAGFCEKQWEAMPDEITSYEFEIQ